MGAVKSPQAVFVCGCAESRVYVGGGGDPAGLGVCRGCVCRGGGCRGCVCRGGEWGGGGV